MNLKDKINDFPQKPGIYMMKDSDDNIIYVGKSKKLKNRIRSYFISSANHSRKIQRMVKNIKNIEIITTDTELDALILECEMIQKIKPMYNTLMKKYENYKYIKVDIKKEFPILQIVNEVDENDIYFGPHTIDKKLEEIKNIFIEVYKLPTCKKQIKCINYSLNKCIGPCRGIITKDEYRKIIDKIINTLQGDNTEILDILKCKMSAEIDKLNFENAHKIKGSMNLIKNIFRKQNIINNIRKQETMLAWISIDEDKYKLYLIESGEILASKIINVSNLQNVYIKDLILDVYSKYIINCNKHSNKKITKNNIDAISIIDSYIKNSSDVKYLII